jgi:guanylate kinase
VKGLILYGPPASGKDTVTRALTAMDGNYRHFERLKCGPGRTVGYRIVTADELARLRSTNELIWENARYGSVYAVDRSSLLADAAESIPVVHLGQPEGIERVVSETPSIRWLVIELWCPRTVAAARIAERSTGDDAQRLSAYDQTKRLDAADLRIDTDALPAEQAAELIHSAWTAPDG